MRRARLILLAAGALMVTVFFGVAKWSAAPEPGLDFFAGTERIPAGSPPKFAIGQYFAAMIAPDGTLWAWGDFERNSTDFGLAAGWKPQRLSAETNWTEIAAAYFGLLALKRDGTLWAIGNNAEGVLGLGTNVAQVSELTRVGSDADWAKIKTGVAHAMALKRDGSLWVWGQNNYGQVGVGAVSPREAPRRPTSQTNWAELLPAAFESIALTTDGTLWHWGLSRLPSPARMDATNGWKYAASGEYYTAALDGDGAIWIQGANAGILAREAASGGKTNWVKMEAGAGWRELMAGEDYLLGRKEDGSWARVNGKPIQAWDVPENFQPLALHCQRRTTLIFMPDGRLWSLGRRIGVPAKESWPHRVGRWIEGLMGNATSTTLSEHSDLRPVLIGEW